VLLFGLAGCYTPAPAPEITDGRPLVEVETIGVTKTDTTLPTDLLPLAGDDLLVLDGYNHRALRIDGETGTATALQGDEVWGQPVRIAHRAEGGYWLADPGNDERQGVVVAIDEAGQTERVLLPTGPEDASEEFDEFAPTVVIEWHDSLVIGDRGGRILWVDPEDGSVTKQIDNDADGLPLGVISDLAVANGYLGAVDALGPRVYFLEGKVERHFGHFGLWAGAMKNPKSLAFTDAGNVVVADSALGVVQLYDRSGRCLGLLAEGEEPLTFEHPVAVRRDVDDPASFYVLSSKDGQVTHLRLAPETEAAAVRNSGRRYLRTRLVETREAPGVDGHVCIQCHDGFVRDGRQNWDDRLWHHPVGVEPEGEVPQFLPLSEEGLIICKTCHSPHGVVDPEWDPSADGDAAPPQRHDVEGVHFTRLSIEDSALCAACHGVDAHESVIAALEVPGGAHPSGAELERALEKRGGPSDGPPEELKEGCLGCHAPHGAEGEPILRGGSTGKCASCHRELTGASRNHPLGKRIGVDVPRPAQSARLVTARDGGLVCRTCHDLVGGAGSALLRRPESKELLCLSCHDERKGLLDSPHSRVRGDWNLPCLGCHDVHGGRESRSYLVLRAGSREDPLACLSCHGDGREQERDGPEPGDAGHPMRGETDDGETVEGCPSCHDVHLATIPGVEECGDCHADQRAEEQRGGHGDAACQDCHPVHDREPVLAGLDAEINPVSRRCMACHSPSSRWGEAPRVEDYEHPAPVFGPDGVRWEPLGDLPLFGPDGSRVPAGVNGDLTCETCHLVHGPDPVHPGINLRRPGWEASCASCHGRSSLSYYLYFHEPTRRRGKE